MNIKKIILYYFNKNREKLDLNYNIQYKLC